MEFLKEKKDRQAIKNLTYYAAFKVLIFSSVTNHNTTVVLFTVVPTKSDSDVTFCLQLLSKH